MVGWTEARTDGSTDGQTGGQKDGWTDGWMYKASGKRSVVRMKIVFTSYTVALTALTIISVLESGANIFLPSFYNSLNRLRGNRTSKKLNLFFADNRTPIARSIEKITHKRMGRLKTRRHFVQLLFKIKATVDRSCLSAILNGASRIWSLVNNVEASGGVLEYFFD